MSGDDQMEQKLLLITFGTALGVEVVEMLDSQGQRAFTRWVRAHGVGTTSPPHTDTHIWPGTNQVLAVVMPADRVAPILERLRAIKESAPKEGLRAFVLPVEDGV